VKSISNKFYLIIPDCLTENCC